jgi:hypothetical protein
MKLLEHMSINVDNGKKESQNLESKSPPSSLTPYIDEVRLKQRNRMYPTSFITSKN